MSTILPKGESLRKAVKWISEAREQEGAAPLFKLIEDASLKFNLSPSDQQFLQRFFQKNRQDP